MYLRTEEAEIIQYEKSPLGLKEYCNFYEVCKTNLPKNIKSTKRN
jgi:hypothetical protein